MKCNSCGSTDIDIYICPKCGGWDKLVCRECGFIEEKTGPLA